MLAPTARHSRHALIVLTLILCCAESLAAEQLEVYFSPRGGAAAAIAAKIDAATNTINVAAYSLSQSTLCKRLADAAHRGVQVQIIVDRRMEAKTERAPAALRAAGCHLRTDAAEPLHHNKYCIIDARIVVTGSMNWSDNGENRNAENTLILDDAATAARFAANFATHWAHSRAYQQRLHAPKHRTSTPAALYPLHKPAYTKEFVSWHVSQVP